MDNQDGNTVTSIDNDLNPDLNKNLIHVNVLVTNARSLAPKINSLQTMFEESGLHFAIITESWLNDGEMLNRDVIDLEQGSGLGILYKNRPKRSASNRKVGGGVSIVFDKSRANFRERKIAGNKFEIVAAVGRVQGIAREIVVVSIYLPPKIRVAQLSEINDMLGDLVLQLKASATGEGPLFFIGGDLNKRDISSAFEDFNDIERKNFDPTRGNVCLDILYSNADITCVTTEPALETNFGQVSDHSCVVATAAVKIEKKVKWVTRTARKHTDEAVRLFGESLADTNWEEVLGNEKQQSTIVR